MRTASSAVRMLAPSSRSFARLTPTSSGQTAELPLPAVTPPRTCASPIRAERSMNATSRERREERAEAERVAVHRRDERLVEVEQALDDRPRLLDGRQAR